IRTGETFSIFENYLMGTDYLGTISFPGESMNDHEKMTHSISQWIYGGKLTKANEESISISVEANVESIQLQMFTSEKVDSVQLRNSKGENVPVKIGSDKKEEGIFADAHTYVMTIENPKSGEWDLIMEGQEDIGYLLVADYDAPTKLIKGEVDYSL